MTDPSAMLIDTTLCTGCEKCVAACKQENDLGADVPRRWKARIDDLSSTRYTTMIRKPGNRFVRQLCRHCNEPACESACIVGAIQKTPEGPVIYDAKKCMGCRYCMMACPYGIPRYDWEKPVPLVRKCTLCAPRLAAGQQPACVEACPTGACAFGTRTEMLEEADRRQKAEPDRYVGNVFGDTEVGGTSVLYLSDIDLGFLSYAPELSDQALPDLTWAALSKVPPLILGMAGLMTGVFWITGRRMRLAEEAAARAPAAAEKAPESAGDDGEAGA